MQDSSTNLPKLVKANISGGQITAWGRKFPLPISGTGLFSVMYIDDTIRVFSDQKKGTVSVQMQADKLRQLISGQWYVSDSEHMILANKICGECHRLYTILHAAVLDLVHISSTMLQRLTSEQWLVLMAVLWVDITDVEIYLGCKQEQQCFVFTVSKAMQIHKVAILITKRSLQVIRGGNDAMCANIYILDGTLARQGRCNVGLKVTWL